ncbi:MAG: ferritin family protein [Candidatus Cloacimonas sp.]|nr:ferritin family protein [Candidatus Cloacimonas sp.]
MQQQEFEEILDFAISREEEAVKFYQELQEQSQFQDVKNMLKDLEMMENGHIQIIENIRITGVKEEDIQKVPNLNISEYLCVDPSDLDMSYQNLLVRAMKREENSFLLYSEMSVKFPDAEIATLFRRLAADEAKHKLFFENLYDDWIRTGN